MILFLISFIAGVLTVLAPCTITLLPVIVGGTVSGGSSLRRAVVVTTSLGVSVIAFTFALKASTLFLTIPQEIWQGISGSLIVVLGVTMLFPTLWERIPVVGKIQQRSNLLIGSGYQKQNMVGDIIIGAALGPVFSSCSPTYFLILAEVLPRSIPEGAIYLLAYVIGLSGALLLIAVSGQRVLEKAGVASDPEGYIKRGVGVAFIVIGFAIFFGYDKKLELAVADHIFDVSKIELSLLAQHPKTPVSAPLQFASPSARISEKLLRFKRAPEIARPSGFIHTEGTPITLAEFMGKKVVLVDFWTYSCINCQRTLPYMNAWYEKYHNQGLEIVGIHTPEFSFEHVLSNVESAVNNFGIQYPVILDNDFGTWNAFRNNSWPHKYLIDMDGFVVYEHAGEGEYDATAQAIEGALRERAAILNATSSISFSTSTPDHVVPVDFAKIHSPEIYFGSARNEYLGNGVPQISGAHEFVIPKILKANTLYLGGTWQINEEYAHANGVGSTIVFTYDARNMYMVASSAEGARATVTVDGNAVGAGAGTDVDVHGNMFITNHRLYQLIQGSSYGVHTIRIEVTEGSLDAYTFTFG